MTIIAQSLDASSISAAQTQAETISAAATQRISSNQFGCFVAFGGTGHRRRASARPFSPGVLHGLGPALLLLLHLASHAQPRPLDFTPEERSLFSDFARAQRRTELPLVDLSGSAAGWLDDSHVIYATREIAGVWKAAPDEFPKIVLFDVRARTVQETRYRGNLVCFSPARMLLSHPSSGTRPGFNPQLGDRLFSGRFGDALVPIADLAGKEIVPVDCTLNPLSTGVGPDAPTEIPLREGDGFLRVPRGAKQAPRTGSSGGYELLDARRQLVQTFSGTGHPRQPRVHYVPWLHAYFSDKGSSGRSEFVWPDGRRRVVDPPLLLAAFSVASNVGSGAAIPTRAGVLWDFVTWRGYWRMQGIYLLAESGALRRIDDGHVPGQPRVSVSPDGCQIFYFRREGDPFNARVPFIPTVMNVCEGDQK